MKNENRTKFVEINVILIRRGRRHGDPFARNFSDFDLSISLPQGRGSFADFASVGRQGVDEDAI